MGATRQTVWRKSDRAVGQKGLETSTLSITYSSVRVTMSREKRLRLGSHLV